MRHVIKFHRHRFAKTAVLVDEELEPHSLDQLREWAARGEDFVVIDSESGEDITQVLLA